MPGGKMEQQGWDSIIWAMVKKIKYPRKRIVTDNVKWQKEGTKHLLTDGYRLDVIFCNYYGGWEKKRKGTAGGSAITDKCTGKWKILKKNFQASWPSSVT